MTFEEIKKLLNGKITTPQPVVATKIKFAYASDLMSDILVNPKPGALILTGLANTQSVRTCKIAGACAIIFVRNKKPTDETIKLAQKYNIPFFTTDLSMFDACGILHSHGVKGILSHK